MNREKRNIERMKKFHPKISIHTVIEISEKINELIEQMEYNNNEMLLTKEHIKHNLIELIHYADYLKKIESAKQKKSENQKKAEKHSNFSNNYYIENRGRLITSNVK